MCRHRLSSDNAAILDLDYIVLPKKSHSRILRRAIGPIKDSFPGIFEIGIAAVMNLLMLVPWINPARIDH